MLICIFSLFISAYRAIYIHAIMLKAKAASWQNCLLMYWPIESVGTITEPRVCRGLPKQFCIQAGSLFSISPSAWWASGHKKKCNSTTCKKKKKKSSREMERKQKPKHVGDETRPHMPSFLHISLLENVSRHSWELFSPTAHAITSTQTCSRCYWACVGVGGHWLRAALKEEWMHSNAVLQDNLLKHVWISLALD